jgi:IPT/TIG domain
VSVATDGTSASAGTSLRPVISQNGRFVAFDSAAVLTAGDSNGARDVFVHDRDLDRDNVMDEAGAVGTRRVSVAANGGQALGGDSVDPSITGDGRYVVYASTATTLVAGDTNGVSDIFLHDRDADADGLFDEAGQIATRRVTVGAGGSQFTVPSGVPRISANGRLLVFLVANAASNAITSGSRTIAAVGASDPGKSTPWTQSGPTGPQPEPPGKSTPGGGSDPPAETETDTDDVTTSPDGDEWGGTDVTDTPKVVIVGEPEETIESPEIATVSPGGGSNLGGSLVIIEGNDLAGTLYWNGTPVLPLTTSGTRWTVLAPPRGAAPATVSLYLQDGDRRSNLESFTYVAQSVLGWTDHRPREGSIAGSIPLTITGSGFTAATTVRIGSEPAVVTDWTATTLTATLPPAYVAGPASIIIINPDGAEAVAAAPFTYENAVEPVSLTGIEPRGASSVGGTAVTITGSGFTESTTVAFGDRAASGVQFLSSRTLVVQAPPAPEGSVSVVVTVPGQAPVSTAFDYATQTFPTTCDGDDADGDGMDDAWEAQFGLVAVDAADGGDDPDHDGLTSAQECQAGSHPRSFYTRYLAEGATGSFFDTRVSIANPNSSAARLLLRFQTETGRVVRQYLVVPEMARRTIDVRLLSGLESANISTVIESDVQVVVDRTMRWDRVSRSGAHAETSSPAPSLVWYLAEGATHGSFDLFYLLQNPSSTQTAQVQIRYLLPAGPPIVQTVNVAPNSRSTVYVDEQPGLSAIDVSAVLTSLNGVPIIVERAMYSSAAGTFAAGHDSAGVTSPSLEWFFAEGSTGSFFDTFVLLANPNDSPANVHATYLLPSGQTVQKDYVVPANSRRTFNLQIEDARLAGTDVSTRLTSTNGISFIAERSMWWPHGQPWFEAHNAAGATTTGTKWAVADGEVGLLPEDTATFILIANTSAFAGTVRVTLLFEGGNAVSQDFTVAGNARFNVQILPSEAPVSPNYMRAPRGTRFGAVVESLGGTPAQIVVERAMYWNANGQGWAAGSDVLATRIR